MKRQWFLIVGTILLGVTVLIIVYKGQIDANDLSLVRKPNAETQQFLNSVDSWVAKQDPAKLNSTEFHKYIYAANPNIDWDVTNELTRYGKIKAGERIHLKYFYFNEEGKCKMQDSSKKYHDVTFKNKFVVKIEFADGKEDLWISLSCLNGMLDISSNAVVLTSADMTFTIEKGQGLSTYLKDDLWSITVAEAFGLDLYAGKIQKPKYKISPNRARQLVPNVDKNQITVHTEPNWKFRLDGNYWTLNGKNPTEFKNPKN